MTLHYFAYGSSLAGLANLETLNIDPPSVLDTGGMARIGAVKQRLMSGRLRRDGALLGGWMFNGMYADEVDALVYALWGGYDVASAQWYISTPDSSGHYSPFLAWLDQPVMPDDSRAAMGQGRRDVMVPIRAASDGLQALTKTSNFTVTTSTHLLYADTSGGSITFALPALSGVTANVVYSFVKTSAINSMILDPNGAETIDGAATKTLTALNARTDIVKNDAGVWVSITA